MTINRQQLVERKKGKQMTRVVSTHLLLKRGHLLPAFQNLIVNLNRRQVTKLVLHLRTRKGGIEKEGSQRSLRRVGVFLLLHSLALDLDQVRGEACTGDSFPGGAEEVGDGHRGKTVDIGTALVGEVIRMLDESSVEFSDNSNKRCKTCDDLQYMLLVVKLDLVGSC